MSFRPLAADALVFFTALGGASGYGYGGHTGGAFDMMPEDRSRGGACGCFKKCEAQDLQIFNRRVANTHTAIPQVSTSSTIDSNSPITFAQVLVHFQLFSDPIVCHTQVCISDAFFRACPKKFVACSDRAQGLGQAARRRGANVL